MELRLPYPTQQQQQQPKRRSSPHSSDDENNPFFMMSSEEDSSEEEDDLGDSGGAGTSGDDDLIEDENLYRKRCVFLKRLAKSIVFVRCLIWGLIKELLPSLVDMDCRKCCNEIHKVIIPQTRGPM